MLLLAAKWERYYGASPSYWWNWRHYERRLEGRLQFHLLGKRHILLEWLLLTLLLDPRILGVILPHPVHHFFAMYITTFPAIRRRTSPTPIGRAPRFLFSGINRLAVKASKLLYVCEFERCIFVLHNRFTKFLWIFEVLRDWSQIDWKPRFCANYQYQVQMGHILLIAAFLTKSSSMSS